MLLKPIALVCVAFVWAVIAKAQSTSTDSNTVNPQRTRVLNTRGLETAPTQILWKTEKLFHNRASEWITADNGTFRFNIDLPTGQRFSVPVIARDLIYFTYVATDGFLFAIDRLTGQKLLVLKLDNNRVSRPVAKDNIVFFGSASGQFTLTTLSNVIRNGRFSIKIVHSPNPPRSSMETCFISTPPREDCMHWLPIREN